PPATLAPRDRGAGALLGLAGAALRGADPVENAAELALALHLLRLELRQALGPGGAGLRLGGPGLHFLEALHRARERLLGPPLAFGEALLGRLELAGQRLLLLALAVELRP